MMSDSTQDNSDDPSADARQQRMASMLAILSGVPGISNFGKTVIGNQDEQMGGQLKDLDTAISQNLGLGQLAQSAQQHKDTLLESMRYHNMEDQERKDKLSVMSTKGNLTPEQDTAMNTVVDMVGDGKLSVQEGMGRAGANRMEFLSRLGTKYPDYNSPDFKAKTAAVQAFATGAQGQQLIRMQNANNHLALLQKAGEALDNGDLPAINRIVNAFGMQGGSSPAVAYNAILPIVANEVQASIIKGGGGEAERQQRVADLSSSLNSSQRSAAISGIRGILGAQALNYRNQYQTLTSRNDFDTKYPGLTDMAASQTPTVSRAPGAPQAPSAWGKATVVSQ
jgi:hypothetical protein